MFMVCAGIIAHYGLPVPEPVNYDYAAAFIGGGAFAVAGSIVGHMNREKS